MRASLHIGLAYNIVRKRKYSHPGEALVGQLIVCSNGQMFLEGIVKGDRVVVLDDILFTGGNMGALIKALRRIAAHVIDILVVVEKGDQKEKLEDQLGIKIKTLVKVEVKNCRLLAIS